VAAPKSAAPKYFIVENEIREREMRQRIDWRLSKSQEQVLRGALVWLGRKDLIEKKIVIARNWK
jgi:FPC/CPF motif-containing protein YcgG